jgi:hypothetical protein
MSEASPWSTMFAQSFSECNWVKFPSWLSAFPKHNERYRQNSVDLHVVHLLC